MGTTRDEINKLTSSDQPTKWNVCEEDVSLNQDANIFSMDSKLNELHL